MNYNKREIPTAVLLLMAVLINTPLWAQSTLPVVVKNNLGFDRNEVVAISSKDISSFLKDKEQQGVGVKDKATGLMQTVQWIDYDADNYADELLFMARVKANDSVVYLLENLDGNIPPLEMGLITYSRFVPERTDDYAWENDKVAFRTYGPDAQQRAEQKRENGTLSSGIDIWLKSTSEPVINKWYKGYLTDPMFYHKDRGEGYDPYHVGASRGTGGTGIWLKDSLLVSKNFVTYTTIATGPLRTVFELTYAPYSAYDVKEKKRISLDLGSNFSRFEVSYASQKPVPNFAIGITLHQNEGKAELLKDKGIFAHHEKIDGIYVGEGIVIAPESVDKCFVNKSKTKDQSNLIIVTKPLGKVIYYAGFAWGKGGQATNAPEWDALLAKQAAILASPLVVEIK